MKSGQQAALGHGATLHTSGCLCPPPDVPRTSGHVCVHGLTLWVRHDGAWYRPGVRSWHKALTVGRRCESWGQVVADLDLVLWVDR